MEVFPQILETLESVIVSLNLNQIKGRIALITQLEVSYDEKKSTSVQIFLHINNLDIK